MGTPPQQASTPGTVPPAQAPCSMQSLAAWFSSWRGIGQGRVAGPPLDAATWATTASPPSLPALYPPQPPGLTRHRPQLEPGATVSSPGAAAEREGAGGRRRRPSAGARSRGAWVLRKACALGLGRAVAEAHPVWAPPSPVTPASGPVPPAPLPPPSHPGPHLGPSACESRCPGMRAEVLRGEGPCAGPTEARAHPAVPTPAGAASPLVVSCGTGQGPSQPSTLFQGGWGRLSRSPKVCHGPSWASCLPPVGSDATWAHGVFPAQGGRASAPVDLPPSPAGGVVEFSVLAT
ncbi:PREDICTED: formin-like protein 5 [Cercocebus atys]|uniref:formin-like protein 5 n=1 Tax=Cercocebus atys TaxID=9531 RepID=UPI0005F55796|nr:PREDICTED: formin-like protein 5 [Cercocebus atys]